MQFLGAVATRQALEEETRLPIKLKWPNDLILENSKLGGILIESKTQGGRISFAILGIGVNINQSRAQLPPGATSLQLVSGKQYDLRSILRSILNQFRTWYNELDNPSKIMEVWWHNCAHRPLRVQVNVSTGVVTGFSRGIDDDGSLLIETDDRMIRKVNEGSLILLDR